MAAPTPLLDHETRSGAHLITLARPEMIDAALIREVGDQIYRIVRGLDAPRVVIDFRNVQRLSSAALGMLVALDKVIRRRQGQLRLCNVDKKVYEVFKITDLHRVMKIHGDADDAVGSFEDGGRP